MAASEAASEVVVARELADALKQEVGGMPLEDNIKHKRSVQEDEHSSRRVEALAMRLAGFTTAQIGERLGLSENSVSALVNTTLQRAENSTVTEMRTVENQRLDRAQLAIWPEVLRGDIKAIDTFLKISQQRSKINGLYAPTKIDMNIGIRNEMQGALADLERLMNERAVEVVDAEVVPEIENHQPPADFFDADEPEYNEDYR